MGQRFEGRSLDEALQTAAEGLGAERYKLTYHVVVEKRGFLGGLKRIVIEASVDEGAAAPAPQPPPMERTFEAGSRENRGRRGGRDRDGGRGPRQRARGPRETRERRDDMHREEAIVNSSGATVDEVVPEQAEQSDAARRVAEWTMELFGLARIEALVRTEEDEEAISVRIFGRDAGRFTDRDGELLDSVQVIVNKALAFTIGKPIELDSGSFKHDRMEAIGHRALEAAELVRQDGREQLLPAMSPIERRIVHIALRDAPDLTTESRGEGFFKRVAIIPKPAEPTVES